MQVAALPLIQLQADIQSLRRHIGQNLESGFGKVVTLKQFYALLRKPRDLGEVLHTLGQQVDMQIPANLDNSAYNCLTRQTQMYARDQFSAQLVEVGLVFSKQVEARIPRTKIVDGRTEAMFYIVIDDI